MEITYNCISRTFLSLSNNFYCIISFYQHDKSVILARQARNIISASQRKNKPEIASCLKSTVPNNQNNKQKTNFMSFYSYREALNFKF